MSRRTGAPTPEVASGAAGLPEKVEDVLELVALIPAGKVATYGDVAEMVGGRGARFVGNVLSRYSSDLPWWRVLRAGGYPPQGLEGPALEHYLEEGTPLLRETVEGLRVDLSRARWEPDLSEGPAADPVSAAPPAVRGTLHHVEAPTSTGSSEPTGTTCGR